MVWIRVHPILSVVIVTVGAMIGVIGFLVSAPAAQLRNIASEEFSPQAAAIEMEHVPLEATTTTSTIAPAPDEWRPEIIRFEEIASLDNLTPIQLARVGSPTLPDEMFTSVLLIGSDASGALADSIIYVLLPDDGSAPIMVSIPRDLWLPNRCKERFSRINANLNGCGDMATGPELLALAVGDFTGVAVDHYARVNFAGFANVINWMGGVSVCVNAPTRDLKSHLEIPAGCMNADGETALAWVRSRHTEQLVGEEWVAVPSSDFSRQSRQQDVLLQLARKLAAYRSPTSLADALGRLSSAVRLDDGWGLTEIATLGFRYRSLDRDDVIRLKLPTEDYRSSGGAWVLLPQESFNDTLSAVYPAAEMSFAG